MTLPQLEDATLGAALAAAVAAGLLAWCLWAMWRRKPSTNRHEDDWDDEGGGFV